MTETEPTKTEWSVLIVIIIGTFMAILNGSIVNVALPKIMAIFNAGPDSIQWVLTCYIMTMGVIMPVTGYLGDTFGYKRTYFWAMAIFIAGSMLCGISWNVTSLIAARVLQAIGAGIMQPLGMAFIYRVTPRSQIGMVLGIWGIAAMAAPAIGPTLGGYIVEYVNWRLIFYLNVPIGIINLFLARMLLKESLIVKTRGFDYIGLITASVGLFCLLLALSEGAKFGWSSPYIIFLLLLSFSSLTVFVFNELRHPAPLLELRLFKNGLFTISTVIGSVLNIGMFGGVFLIPLLLQNVLGQTAMKTGLILFPAAICTAAIMPVSGKIFDRYGARGVTLAGLFLVAVTTYIMGGFNESTPFIVMTGWLVLRAAGMGLAMMPVTTAGMATVPMHLVAHGSALGNVVRQVSGSLGVALFTTIMQNRQVEHFAQMSASVNMNSPDAQALQGFIQGLGTSLGLGANSQVIGVSIIAQRLTKMSMVQAIGDCFIVASIFCLFAFFLSFFLREPARKIAGQPSMAPETPVKAGA